MSSDRFAVIDQLGIDHELVFRFFAVFSRFEFALKRSGEFLRADVPEAKPDWSAFAAKIEGRFESSEEPGLQDAYRYLLAEPPNTQMRSDGRVTWQRTDRRASESDEAYVLRLVRTTRNNLFHGGKYPEGDGGVVDEPGRNERLLKAGLDVLAASLRFYPSLEERFAEAA